MSIRIGDRIAGAILLALAIAHFIAAGSFTVAFGDPAGPALFPRIVAVPLGLFSLFLLLRPDPDVRWFRWPQAAGQFGTLAVLLAYPIVLEPLGFPLATTLATIVLSKILGGTWLQATATGLVVGFGLFFLFDAGFGLPLPAGPIFG
ncbi:tripartite tricarboxylate transporter TctB family protein [Aurantimonas sp. A2-1-M11]|uniref:tripartite tricarboxylate transporter TctB family protein n=1 Tax=Aurantimonas sp. A2-1-M11 TaxID=3113712 RepID=UPI002F92A8D3